jgi:hypothetical protein
MATTCSGFLSDDAQLRCGRGNGGNDAILTVVSVHNREGLTSLVEKEMVKDPTTILFDSLEKAVAAVETVFAKVN